MSCFIGKHTKIQPRLKISYKHPRNLFVVISVNNDNQKITAILTSVYIASCCLFMNFMKIVLCSIYPLVYGCFYSILCFKHSSHSGVYQ